MKRLVLANGSVVTALLATMSSSAFADGSQFHNSLLSPLMVSPAQDYQVAGTQIDVGYTGGVGATSVSGSGDNPGYKYKETDSSYALRSVVAIPGSGGLRLGIGASDERKYLEDKATFLGMDLDFKNSAIRQTISPEIAYQFGPLVLGLAYDSIREKDTRPAYPDFVGDEMVLDGAAQYSSNWGRYRPGIALVTGPLEIGATYWSPTFHQPQGSTSRDGAISDPARLIVHGRYALDSEVAFGAVLTDIGYSSHSHSELADQLQTRVTIEVTEAALKVEGYLGYDPHYYKAKTDQSMTPGNISMARSGVSLDVAVAQAATVGGGLDLGSGSDTNGDTKITVADVAVSLRAGLKF